MTVDSTEYLLNALNLAYNLDPNGTDIELMAAAITILEKQTKNASGINESRRIDLTRAEAEIAVTVLENIRAFNSSLSNECIADALGSTVKALEHVDGLRRQVA